MPARTALLVLVLVAATGCPQPLTIAEGERRPDAAVETFPPDPSCDYEAREVGPVTLGPEGVALARLLRWREGSLVLRIDGPTASEPAKVVIDRVGRDGTVHREGESRDTGAPAQVVAFDAATGSGELLVALTRRGQGAGSGEEVDAGGDAGDSGGERSRVDLVGLSLDGATERPLTSVEDAGARGGARVLWFREAALLGIGGRLVRPDGDRSDIPSSDAAVADGGARADGGHGADAGGEPTLPSGVLEVIVAGEALGWLHRDEEGVWLSHAAPGSEPVRTTRVAPAEGVSARWVGDRYVVADATATAFARYSIPTSPRRGSKAPSTFRLGGRIVLPRPPGPVARSAWANAGPRHIGLAQLLQPRHIRFLNVALAGQMLDAAIHVTTERDVSSISLVWDGRAYVMMWVEQVAEDRGQVKVARFTCPDDT